MIIIQSREPGQELEERILAILRREQIRAERICFPAGERLSFPGLCIDAQTQQVTRDGARVWLTRIEFNLLLLLASSAGTVFSKETLLRAVWGPDSADTLKVVANTVSNLRGKLGCGQRYIRTVRGGYVFSAPPESS